MVGSLNCWLYSDRSRSWCGNCCDGFVLLLRRRCRHRSVSFRSVVVDVVVAVEMGCLDNSFEPGRIRSRRPRIVLFFFKFLYYYIYYYLNSRFFKDDSINIKIS